MNGIGSEYDEDDEFDELIGEYEQILQEQTRKEAEARNPDEVRKIRIDGMKRMMKAAFLTNTLATEKDFERLWPRIFDDMLIEFTRDTQLEAMSRLLGDLDDDEDEDDDEFDEDEN
jgi:hypothetical protein